MPRFRRLARFASTAILIAFGSLALSLVSGPSLRAQARITLQSLQNQVDNLIAQGAIDRTQISSTQTQVASLQAQVASVENEVDTILGGQAPVGRVTASQFVNLVSVSTAAAPAATVIPGRSLNFSKASASSRLKITYSDHAYVPGQPLNYHIDLVPLIDGQPIVIGGSQARLQQYVGAPPNNSNVVVHQITLDTLVPAGLAAGAHALTISVRAVPASTNTPAPTVIFGGGYPGLPNNDQNLPVLMQVEELP
jgi:hypothetical protein